MPKSAILFITLLLASVPVLAGDFYAVAEVTHTSDTLDTSQFNSQITNAHLNLSSSATSGTGNQWRLQAGYHFNDTFAAEAGYIDFGKAKYTGSTSSGGTQGTLQSGGINLVGVVNTHPIDKLALFGKLGVVLAQTKATLQGAGLNSSQNVNSVSPLIGVGATWKISNQIDLRTDLDYVPDLGNNSTGKMNARMASIGAVWNF